MANKVNLSPEKTLQLGVTQSGSPSKIATKALSLFNNIETLAQEAEHRQFFKRTLPVFASPDVAAPQKKLKNEVLDLSVAGTTSKAPPSTPVKRKISSPSTPKSPHEKLYVDVNTTLSLTIQDIRVALRPFAEGTFMASYLIEAPKELIPSIPNHQLVVKLYHGKFTKFTSRLSEYMQNSISNYLAVEKLGIPVATIYNKETALTDLYFLVEKIPHAVDVNEEHQLEQVVTLFQQSFQNKVLIDLSYSNLRVREDGTVTLIDFVEKPFDFNHQQKLQMFAIQFLKSWCEGKSKADAEKLLHRLTQGLDKCGFNPNWNQAALDACFIEINI